MNYALDLRTFLPINPKNITTTAKQARINDSTERGRDEEPNMQAPLPIIKPTENRI